MANRILLGDIGSSQFGLKVSKPSVNVLTATDKQLLFDSRKNRTAQIYAGAAGVNFVNSTTQTDSEVVGTVTSDFPPPTNARANLTGKKIIIDGTTVTLSTTTSGGGFIPDFTSTANMVTDINAANITGITANVRSISASDKRLRITKDSANGNMVISYPSSNSLESFVGINAATYAVKIVGSSGINYLTATGSTKAGLNYIPLITLAEKITGQDADSTTNDNGDETAQEGITNLSLWETTNSHMYPVSGDANGPSPEGDTTANQSAFSVGTPTDRGRTYNILEDADIDVQCEDCSFFVLRIPLGYGFMTSTYYG